MSEENKNEVDCWAYGAVEEVSISKAFAENRVVMVEMRDDGKFDVSERCDDFFGATLTAEQLAKWGWELVELSGVEGCARGLDRDRDAVRDVARWLFGRLTAMANDFEQEGIRERCEELAEEHAWLNDQEHLTR